MLNFKNITKYTLSSKILVKYLSGSSSSRVNETDELRSLLKIAVEIAMNSYALLQFEPVAVNV